MIPGGWLDHNWKQLYKQFAYIVAVAAYTFVVTAILAKSLDVVGLRLRITPEEERLGMDEVEVSKGRFLVDVSLMSGLSQVGEFANDYIEIRRDYTDGMRPFDSSETNEGPAIAGDRHGVPDVGEHEGGRNQSEEANATQEKNEADTAEQENGTKVNGVA